MFVNAEGVRRAYKFKPSDSRVLEEQPLERQLNAAAFMPTTKEDKSAYSLSDAERRTAVGEHAAPAASMRLQRRATTGFGIR